MARAASTARAATTKQQRVYEALRERILSGSYGPGFRVVIDAVAAEFGVSPVPVREAIRRLEAEGLVVYRPNAGAQVTPAEPGLFEQELTVLALLEGYATALAAPCLAPADLDRLRATTDSMAAAMQRMDPLAFGRRNHEFHEIVYERCPNQALVEMLRDVGRRLDAIRRTVFTHIPYRGAESIAEHRAIIDRLAAGAPADEIEQLARAHKLRTVESFRAWQRDHEGEPAPAPPA
ncbi:MAG TPA: GntR family transcriptional regulator [Solirubrobacteraceae bacterium]|nr:GntR family transcriptional regulator [Solirubrobacteraceae bacterium]